MSVAEPRSVRAFWEGWLAWSRREGIDYLIGRRLPATLATLGTFLGHCADPAWWTQTIAFTTVHARAPGD